MAFWRKKRKHDLPRFPDSVAPTFRMLCEAIPPEEAEELRQAVDENFEGMNERKRDNDRLDIEGARQLTERCYYLLDRYTEFTDKEQALIIGAIRYFAIGEDAYDDELFASGLYDDKKVMNYVLEELGILEQIIHIA